MQRVPQRLPPPALHAGQSGSFHRGALPCHHHHTAAARLHGLLTCRRRTGASDRQPPPTWTSTPAFVFTKRFLRVLCTNFVAHSLCFFPIFVALIMQRAASYSTPTYRAVRFIIVALLMPAWPGFCFTLSNVKLLPSIALCLAPHALVITNRQTAACVAHGRVKHDVSPCSLCSLVYRTRKTTRFMSSCDSCTMTQAPNQI